jgi:hypothetical protein
VGITACAGGGLSYTGRTAQSGKVIPLAGGDVREFEWQTGDLIIDATYALDANQLDLAGLVQLQNKLLHYPIVDHLRIDVHAVDGDGVILASYPLWDAGVRRELYFVNWAFQVRYAVPGNTRALTFRYRGRMRDGGGEGIWGRRDDGGISWDFWHTP